MFSFGRYPPKRKSFKLVFSIYDKLSSSKKIQTALKVVNQVITFNYELKENNYEIKHQSEEDRLKSKLLKYLLGYTFGTEKEYVLENPINSNKDGLPVFIGRGSVNISEQIEDYIDKIKRENKNISKDLIHELKVTLNKVRSLNYRGLVIVFLGATKIRKPNKSKYCCELDGIIFFPNKGKEVFSYIIEAKNYTNGSNDAKNQLQSRLDSYLLDQLNYQLEEIGNRGASASLFIRKQV
ncbi:hypothetical protein J416_14787 [Gracilibacillus halophilus YIM-C55.5]|uniref:Uncharacterized protein n=1 Tax=Gracilibacillus halophilus YIM-C55.5 TaxID=1308866 RepID=N4W649_9BACI|nr:hypothetical protein [Gracilibacillus halophilus]ENH95683.1 hypothetical protein J416_14787 [Gracilibacillus halophilus YIM-C55.5]